MVFHFGWSGGHFGWSVTPGGEVPVFVTPGGFLTLGGVRGNIVL